MPLHLLVKWEVVSPNSREGQLESISIISLYSLVLILYLKCGGGGGVMFFSHFMLFPAFLEKIIWEYKPIISHLMFSSCFFLYAGNIEKVPLHLQLLAKWEVVSPNSRYRAFYHEIEICPFTYWLNGGGGFSKS